MLRKNKGQSTIEYILLVTAVIAVMIVFTTGSNTTGLKGKVLTTYNGVGNTMSGKVSDLTTGQNSDPGTVQSAGAAGVSVNVTMP